MGNPRRDTSHFVVLFAGRFAISLLCKASWKLYTASGLTPVTSAVDKQQLYAPDVSESLHSNNLSAQKFPVSLALGSGSQLTPLTIGVR